MSLSKIAGEILAEKGFSDSIEVQPAGSRQANLFLFDPSQTEQVGELLKKNKIASRRVGAATLEIFAAEDEETEGSDEKQIRKLVSQWREIIKNSSSRFRKASKNLSLTAKQYQKLDPIKASGILANLTFKLAKKQGAAPLMGLARLLHKTAKTKNVEMAKLLLARLSGDRVDPTRPVVKTADSSPRVASPPGQLVTEAEDFIRSYANTSVLKPEAIQNLGNELGEPFESWVESLSVSADVDDAIQAWNLAANNVAGEKGLESQTPSEPQGDVNWAQDTLAPLTASVLDSHTKSRKTRILRLVELCIEHYAAEMNPKEITSEDVEAFLQDHGVSDDEVEKVYKVLNKILKKKETDQESSFSFKLQANIPPTAMMERGDYKTPEAVQQLKEQHGQA